MKKLLCLFFICLGFTHLKAQQIVDLEENKPYSYNGLDYGFYIGNESSKAIKGDDYDRFELNLYVTNNNSCIKLIPFRTGWTSSGSNDEVQVAEFSCTNATGKKLTAKKGSVYAKPWYTYVRVADDSRKEKYRTEYAQVGYAIRPGQTITTRIIVIVPKGERPQLTCRTITLPEIQ